MIFTHGRTRYIASLLLIFVCVLSGPVVAQLGDDSDDTGSSRQGQATPTSAAPARDDDPRNDDDNTDTAPINTDTNAVSIQAADGVMLHGGYFPAGDRAVLLLHQLYSERSSWNDSIGALQAAGFSVLAVDLRGWGDSRAVINWEKAQQDTQLWLDWLYAQEGVRSGGVYLMGASMGANLALVGCMDAPACAGAVALSPGRSYFGVYADAALSSGFPALIAYAENDPYPRRDMPALTAMERFSADVFVYPGRAHGMDLLATQDDLLAEIIAWLATH